MNRNRLLQIYIGVLTVLATGAIVAACLAISHDPPTAPSILLDTALLLPLSIWGSTKSVYFSESSLVLLGTVFQVGAIVALPLPVAVLAVASSKAITEITKLVSVGGYRKRAVLVNVSSSVLAVAGGALAFNALDGPGTLWHFQSLRSALVIPAFLGMGLIYYVLDWLIVAGAITLRRSERMGSVMRQLNFDTMQPELSLIVVGIVFAILLRLVPPLAVLVLVPVYVSMRSFTAVARLRDETEAAVLLMARSVDLRDTGTGVHSQQLEVAAKRLAEALNLTPEHVHDIGLAARAHDLGKIEISDSILLKRGPLTPEERTAMEEHPLIGANMLSSYSSFEKSVEFVKHHHERWDGRGYPDGLKGEEIPLGARIITVVDSYDAMTADRPYRKSLGVDEAVSRLKTGMGSQFDPRVCAAWIQILIEDGIYVPENDMPHLQLVKSEAAG